MTFRMNRIDRIKCIADVKHTVSAILRVMQRYAGAMTSPPPIDLIVGSYADSGGRGLHPLRYDPAADDWTIGEPVATIANASFGVHARGRGTTYLVDEHAGTVASYRGAVDGWQRCAVAATGGAAPCHLALHPNGRWLAVANYGGSAAVLALDPDGTPHGPVALHRIAGRGPDPDRQTSAHAHWVGFDASGDTLWCVDLGTDRILAFAFDATDGALGAPVIAYAAPGGSGPRHLLFHPQLGHAYLVSEMAATLALLRRTGPVGFSADTTLPTLSGAVVGRNIAGGMALNHAADRLYVANRGADTIATFALDGAGHPTPFDQVPSGGRSPRFLFVLDQQARLLVAHEGGDTVTAFTIRPDGRPVDPVLLPIPGAAFIAPAFTSNRGVTRGGAGGSWS